MMSGENAPEPLRRRSAGRSVETQTDALPEFALRRAVSDWGLLERGPRVSRVRSERIRRVAQLFDDMAADAAAVAAREAKPARPGRRAPAAAASPLPEREVLLVPLPDRRPAAASRRVHALVALGGRTEPARPPAAGGDSDADQVDEELLWDKVRSKIAAHRSKFRQLESGEPGPKPSPPARQVSQEKHALPRSALKATVKTAPPSSQQKSTSGGQQKSPSPKPQKLSASTNHSEAVNGDAREATRSWKGKYIEQDEEQTVLRSLGSAVLAKQKLASRQKARDRTMSEKSKIERQIQKTENQRKDVQARIDKIKGKLTRDNAFERKGLEERIFRLDCTLKEQQKHLEKISQQLVESDASITELRRRSSQLAT